MASSAPKGWTDTEKASLFLQIIAKAGPVPWPELTLPEGRTVKACQVMLDKEKQKIKKAREAAGEDVNADVTSPKKRKAADTETGTAKKGRKGKAVAAAVADGDGDEIVVAEKRPKGSKKKKAAKAQVDEDDGEQVKEENDEDAGVQF